MISARHLLIALSLFGLGTAEAQTTPDVSVGQSEPAIPDLALNVGVRSGDASMSALARQLEGAIGNDFRRLGSINQNAAAAAGATNGVDGPPDFAALTNAGVEFALFVVVSPAPAGFQAEFRLWDIRAQQNLTGFQFRSNPDAIRRVGHRIVDRTLVAIGRESEFDSRIVSVAFSSSRLVVIDADGANPFYLTARGGNASPVFHGSDSIVFAAAEGLSLFNFVTGRQTSLITSDRVVGEGGIASAPNGSALAFVVRADDGDTDISIASAQSVSQARVIELAGSQTEPSFAADGSRISFLSGQTGARHIVVSDLDGGNAHEIGAAGDYQHLAWSGTGDEFAFVRTIQGGEELGIMELDGAERLLGTASDFGRPSWSPNGSLLLISRDAQLQTIEIQTLHRADVGSPFGTLVHADWSGLLN